VNPQDVQTGIITTVFNAVEGLHLYDYSADAPIPPALDVSLDGLTYGTTFEDGSEATFLLRVIVGAVASKGSQAQLYDYIAPTGSLSIPAALSDAGSTLQGTVQSSYLLPTRRIGAVSLADGGTKFWSAELLLAVYGLE
jgi:hypothetical protein